MEREKIHGLIREKNERLERDALRTAESIIEEIAMEQGRIRNCQEHIEKLRADLKALSVAQMNAAELLGE